MQRSILIAIAAMVFSFAVSTTASAGSIEYSITDLGDPAGDGMNPLAINQAGQVVGNYQQPQNQNGGKAFIWDPVHGLQTVDALPTSTANAINNSGTVVGRDNQGPFEWTPGGGIVRFQNFFGSSANATGINDSGTISGSDYFDTTQGYTYNASTGFTNLGFLGTGTYSEGNAINNSGQVAGRARNSSQNDEAALWSPSTGWQDLGPVSSGGFVTAINNNSQVVGSFSAVNNFHAFEWSASTGMKDLGTLTGTGETLAYGINDSGVVVGYSFEGGIGTANYDHAVIWSGGHIQDLNSLIDPNAGWTLTSANAINAQGQIVGIGYTGSDPFQHGFLLTPVVPEPSSLIVMGFCIIPILLRRSGIFAPRHPREEINP